MKKVFLAAFMMIAALSAFAQTGPVIDFKDKSHDFGTIKEDDGNVTCEFSFTNKGDAPLVISRVQASCGCTTPDWSKEPIAPGKTGFVKATYAAKGRPGQFSKTITVYCNTKEGTVILNIKGNVLPKTASIEDQYPVSFGDLKLGKINLSFYDIQKTGTKTDKIAIYNSGKSPLSLHFSRVPSHLTVIASPSVIPASGKGEIVVTYKGASVKDWGTRLDDIFILQDNESKIASDRKITVSANIVEDFSILTPQQREKAPRIEASSTNVNFGKINLSDKKTEVITLKNTGKSTLHIRKVKANASLLQVKADHVSVAPGKSLQLQIALIPGKAKSGVNELVSVISNDPSNSVINIHVAATR
jgi:Protein of unknown function (DUF1573).